MSSKKIFILDSFEGLVESKGGSLYNTMIIRDLPENEGTDPRNEIIDVCVCTQEEFRKTSGRDYLYYREGYVNVGPKPILVIRGYSTNSNGSASEVWLKPGELVFTLRKGSGWTFSTRGHISDAEKVCEVVEIK